MTDEVTEEDKKMLQSGGLEPVLVTAIGAPRPSHVSEWDRVGYTKLNLWSMQEWEKLVYIDADCLIVFRTWKKCKRIL
jgi:alpha-N-acetylglucosamine transferase